MAWRHTWDVKNLSDLTAKRAKPGRDCPETKSGFQGGLTYQFYSGHAGRCPEGNEKNLRAFPPGNSSGHLRVFPPDTSRHFLRAPPGTFGHLQAFLWAFIPDIFSGHFLWHLWALSLGKIKSIKATETVLFSLEKENYKSAEKKYKKGVWNVNKYEIEK